MWYFIIGLILFFIGYPLMILFFKKSEDHKYLMPNDLSDIAITALIVLFLCAIWPASLTFALLIIFCHWMIELINKEE